MKHLFWHINPHNGEVIRSVDLPSCDEYGVPQIKWGIYEIYLEIDARPDYGVVVAKTNQDPFLIYYTIAQDHNLTNKETKYLNCYTKEEKFFFEETSTSTLTKDQELKFLGRVKAVQIPNSDLSFYTNPYPAVGDIVKAVLGEGKGLFVILEIPEDCQYKVECAFLKTAVNPSYAEIKLSTQYQLDLAKESGTKRFIKTLSYLVNRRTAFVLLDKHYKSHLQNLSIFHLLQKLEL